MDYIAHEAPQPMRFHKNKGQGCHALSPGSSWPRDWRNITCIGKQVHHHEGHLGSHSHCGTHIKVDRNLPLRETNHRVMSPFRGTSLVNLLRENWENLLARELGTPHCRSQNERSLASFRSLLAERAPTLGTRKQCTLQGPDAWSCFTAQFFYF